MSDMNFGVNLLPTADSTLDIGSNSKHWENLYVDNINGQDASDIGGGGSTALSLTLASGSWSSATPPTQAITATGVTATNNIIVGIGGSLTSAQYEAVQGAAIVCTAQAANSITLTAFGTAPTVDIPVNVLILT